MLDKQTNRQKDIETNRQLAGIWMKREIRRGRERERERERERRNVVKI